MRRKCSPRVSTAVAESAGTCLGTPSRSGASVAWLLASAPFAPSGALCFDLVDMLTFIQSGKRPEMQSRDSQGHLQTIREQAARGSRNNRALVTNTTPYEKPGQVARPGSPGGINGYRPRSRERSRCLRLLQTLAGTGYRFNHYDKRCLCGPMRRSGRGDVKCLRRNSPAKVVAAFGCWGVGWRPRRSPCGPIR